ncbi:MAG: SDR family oxidoreductase [Ferrovibrio sp.]|nr:SDR family oxidoreductase [Ferrovibrio sp.]
MTVQILGAYGLIGSAILKKLPWATCPTRADLDLNDAASIASADLTGNTLVHAAGVTDEEFAADPAAAWLRATRLTQGLLEAATKAGIKRLVYISTAHVYGPLEGDITEARPVNPLGDYALAHYASEQLCRRAALQRGLDVLILRPCAVYGLLPDPARFKRWSLIPFSFPRELLQTGKIVLKSDGEQRRNFVSADAIAAEAAAFLASPAEPGRCRVQNAIGPDDMTVYAFAEHCIALLRPGQGRVERPSPTAGPKPAPLAYRSRYTSAEPHSTLDATIRALAAQIQ